MCFTDPAGPWPPMSKRNRRPGAAIMACRIPCGQPDPTSHGPSRRQHRPPNTQSARTVPFTPPKPPVDHLDLRPWTVRVHVPRCHVEGDLQGLGRAVVRASGSPLGMRHGGGRQLGGVSRTVGGPGGPPATSPGRAAEAAAYHHPLATTARRQQAPGDACAMRAFRTHPPRRGTAPHRTQ
jgi:hypothetical protein